MDLTSISTTQLREYTKKASEMESSVSYIQRMIWDIEAKIEALNTELTNISNRKWRVPEPPKKPVEPVIIDYPKDGYVIMWVLIVLGVVSFLNFRLSMWGQFLAPLLAFPILIGVPILIYFITTKTKDRKARRKDVDIENQSRIAQYNADVQNYPRKMEKYNQECADYNNACRNDEIAKQNLSNNISNLQDIKNEVIKKLNEAEEHTQKFYSVGIIHPKYQGLVPMCRFFEYFDTGKCDTLKEAMHTYDNEVFQGIVIEKLDILNRSVNSLQYELNNVCSVIRQNMNYISSSFNTMNGCLNIINGQLNTQEYYSRITAECNKQIANDISTIKFYEDMKWITN